MALDWIDLRNKTENEPGSPLDANKINAIAHETIANGKAIEELQKNGGNNNGGGGIVDQEYDPTSENAQSGIAVAQAIDLAIIQALNTEV